MALHLTARKLESSGLVNQADIAAWVAKTLAQSEDSNFRDENKTTNTVMILMTAIGKFVAFMFRKTNYETVIADIFGLGSFIRNCTIGKIGVTQFYPTSLFSQELRIFKKYPTTLKEPC